MIAGPAKTWHVALDGRPLNAFVDDLERRVLDIESWHSSAPTSTPFLDRSVGVGSYAGSSHIGAKDLAIVGELNAHGRRDLVATEIEELVALAPDRPVQLQVLDKDLGLRWMTVTREGPVDIRWRGGPHATFRIPLRAHDSRKYGLVSSATTGFLVDPVGAGLIEGDFNADGIADWGAIPTSSGRVTVVNNGTTDAAPIYTIKGPGPALGLSVLQVETGRRVRYLDPIPAGSTVVIDTANGSARIDDVADRSTRLLVGRWPVIGPKSSSSFLFTAEASPTAALLTVDVVSTYS